MTQVYPEYWDQSTSNSYYNKPILTGLNLNHNLAKKVSNRFGQSISGYKIIKIESIQNSNLWDKYCNTKQNLIKTIGINNVNEKYLFHGTKQLIMPVIISQGFRKEFSTVAAYGEGTYFAKDSSYSVGYSEAINNIYKFFLCKVICGEMIIGNGNMKLDNWPKKANGLIYDSLVNRLNNPSIFVIHDDIRVYPMYIIHFKKDSTAPKYQSNINNLLDHLDDEKDIYLQKSISYPNYWDNNKNVNYYYSKAIINDLNLNNNLLCGNISNIFNKTLSKYTIKKIEGLQNGYLWNKYFNIKQNLIKSIGLNNINERYLFHATKEDIMNIIIIEGFRKEFTHRGWYGEGTYLVRDAIRSERYAVKDNNGYYKMFLCCVLCGEMNIGNKQITLRNWPKKNNSLIYDSLVDNKNNPSTFVIHDDNRIYPMYIIHFKKN